MIDLLDLVRSIAAAADRAAENKNYPVPCGPASPLLAIVRQACVERGYTAGGLAVQGLTAGTAAGTSLQAVADECAAFEVWAKAEGLVQESHGIRSTSSMCDVARKAWKTGRAALAAAPVQAQHSDDIAVDRFAATMKAKMAASRAKGRSGWEDPAQCTIEKLAAMLCQHVEKGDPVDIANFAMMIHERKGSAIDVYEALAVFLNSRNIAAPVQAQELVGEVERLKKCLENCNAEIAQLRGDRFSGRAPVQPVAVPDGWKLVPAEPTEEMMHAAQDVPAPRPYGAVYRAMLAAARAAGQSIAATPAGMVFMNDGAEPGNGELDCPACGGSGHAADAAAGSAP